MGAAAANCATCTLGWLLCGGLGTGAARMSQAQALAFHPGFRERHGSKLLCSWPSTQIRLMSM